MLTQPALGYYCTILTHDVLYNTQVIICTIVQYFTRFKLNSSIFTLPWHTINTLSAFSEMQHSINDQHKTSAFSQHLCNINILVHHLEASISISLSQHFCFSTHVHPLINCSSSEKNSTYIEHFTSIFAQQLNMSTTPPEPSHPPQHYPSLPSSLSPQTPPPNPIILPVYPHL